MCSQDYHCTDCISQRLNTRISGNEKGNVSWGQTESEASLHTSYASLILRLGPLIRLCSLRCDSKHSFFKSSVRRAQNFKNVCKTLTHKHFIHQSIDVNTYTSHLYSDAVHKAVSAQVQCKGTWFALNVKRTNLLSNLDRLSWFSLKMMKWLPTLHCICLIMDCMRFCLQQKK